MRKTVFPQRICIERYALPAPVQPFWLQKQKRARQLFYSSKKLTHPFFCTPNRILIRLPEKCTSSDLR